ncbi:ornithine cyclodeaminase [Paenibacillus assamensis]|uniref:ornithine cyclodeaminase n=1 Tax=Paenibacillus assamensis TaxID=311244 RepID=UPI0003F571BF|nr:ornithine cyclodeaminase [Paenibacillus assamensis]
MLYINEQNILKVGIDWTSLIHVIADTVHCINNNDVVQPIKPYLRFRNLKNRIIAMPAFVGGNFNSAGIKWIASYPDNIEKGVPRAHSLVILNDVDTGQPLAIINTPLLSIIRTISISGLVLKWFDKKKSLTDVKLGIIGWGPIGQYHLRMCAAVLGERLSEVYLYDLNKSIDVSQIDCVDQSKVRIVSSWEEAYSVADVFITCTVSNNRYINKKPVDGSLHLNVSLRDYDSSTYEYFKEAIIVDNWEEVCRENTDIEQFHLNNGLSKEGAFSLVDVIINDALKNHDFNKPVMFNPMGLAAFDIAVGRYYFEKSCEMKEGIELL